MAKEKSADLIDVANSLTFTISQAAKLLHTGPSGISRLIKAGKLRALKPTGITLIYKKDLVNFIESCLNLDMRDLDNPVKIADYKADKPDGGEA